MNKNSNRKALHTLKQDIAKLRDIISIIECQILHKLKPHILNLYICVPYATKTNALNPYIRDFYCTINQEYLNQINQKLTAKEAAFNATSTKLHATPTNYNTNKNKKLWSQTFEQIKSNDPLPIASNESRSPQLKNFWTNQQSQDYKYTKYLNISSNPKYTNNLPPFRLLANSFAKQLAQVVSTPPTGEPTYKVEKLTDSIHCFTQITEYVYYIYPQDTTPIKFNQNIKDLLDLGLNYVAPAKNLTSEDSWSATFNNFTHRLLWSHQLRQKQDTTQHRPLPKQLNDNRIKAKPNRNPNLEQWIDRFKNTCLENWNSKPTNSNPATKQFRKAIPSLRENKEIIIKMADKGSGIVIMHTSFYKEIASKFLKENEQVFKLLKTDPTKWIHAKVTNSLNSLRLGGKINNFLHEILQPPIKNKAPNLYFLPKIHKKPNISGRPISSGNGHPAENISIFIDFILKPYAEASTIFIKDSTLLINDLGQFKQLPPHTILFSLDVVNMYTNIPIDEMMDIITLQIQQNPQLLYHKRFPFLDPYTVRILMEIVLKHNNVYFDNNHYLQTNGIAMGTSCACTTTDIYICEWIERNLLSHPSLPKPLYYKQYRDDGFGVWTHSLDELYQLFKHINSLHPSIKFTLKHGQLIEHLDLKISLTSFGEIITETYYKPTDSFQYLHYSSMHPSHTLNNIPVSQSIRHLRNCSNPSTYRKHRLILYHNLLKRKYPQKLLNKKIFSLQQTDRIRYLTYKKRQNQTAAAIRTPLILMYNSINNNRQIQSKLHETFPSATTQLNTPVLGFKNQKTTGSYLIKAKFQSKQD
jgi:hypothetical protein